MDTNGQPSEVLHASLESDAILMMIDDSDNDNDKGDRVGSTRRREPIRGVQATHCPF